MQESIAPKLIEAIKAIFEAAGAAMGGSPLDSSTQHGPVVDNLQFDRIMSYIEKGKQSAQLITGGKRKGSKGCFIEPTLFAYPAPNSPVWKEEIFGPVLTVRTFKTEDEALELANDTEYGLACKQTNILTFLTPILRLPISLQPASTHRTYPGPCACHRLLRAVEYRSIRHTSQS